MVNPKLIRSIQATSELYGRNLSAVAAELFLSDLSFYPEDQILTALAKCRRELRTFPTVADVLQRMSDGRPGVEEAWALLPKSEDESCVWTTEMAEAFNLVRGIMTSDPVGARMAFKETYSRILTQARENHTQINWQVSLGHDRHQREACLRTAVVQGRISETQAQDLLPDFSSEPKSQKLRLVGPENSSDQTALVSISQIMNYIAGRKFPSESKSVPTPQKEFKEMTQEQLDQRRLELRRQLEIIQADSRDKK